MINKHTFKKYGTEVNCKKPEVNVKSNECAWKNALPCQIIPHPIGGHTVPKCVQEFTLLYGIQIILHVVFFVHTP